MDSKKITEVQLGVALDMSYAQAQKILPQVQKRFSQRVKFIVVQDGRVCLVHGW